MTKRHAVKALDISLCDILDKEELPFGGKTIVFGGDFRQTVTPPNDNNRFGAITTLQNNNKIKII
jgi:hypothetical protein